MHVHNVHIEHIVENVVEFSAPFISTNLAVMVASSPNE